MPFVTNHTAFVTHLYAIPKLKYLPSMCHAFMTQFYAIEYFNYIHSYVLHSVLNYMPFVTQLYGMYASTISHFITQLFAIYISWFRDSILCHFITQSFAICMSYIRESILSILFFFYIPITCHLYVTPSYRTCQSWLNYMASRTQSHAISQLNYRSMHIFTLASSTERWGAGVEYHHFQEFKEPYAPS